MSSLSKVKIQHATAAAHRPRGWPSPPASAVAAAAAAPPLELHVRSMGSSKLQHLRPSPGLWLPRLPPAATTAAARPVAATTRTAAAAAAPAPADAGPLAPPTVMTSFPAHLHLDVLSNGLLLVDKPPHWEVAEVVTAVQRATRARKVASVAPLDPAASGLLLLCFGAATRLAQRVEAAPKRYEGSLVLGGAAAAVDVRGGSYTADALPWDHITDEELQEAAEGLMQGAVVAAAPGNGATGGRMRRRPIGNGDPEVQEEAEAEVEEEAEEEEVAEGGQATTPDRGRGGAGGGGGGASVQVLPPRYRLRQYPSSFKYYEEDSGMEFRTRPLRVHEFRVWRASEEDIRRGAAAAAGAAVAAGARLAGAAGQQRGGGGGAVPLSAAAGAATPAAGDVGALLGRVVRFSVLLSGRAHVRSLVDMYGRRLRTCACLDELRRTEVGSFAAGDAWPLEALLPLLERYKR